MQMNNVSISKAAELIKAVVIPAFQSKTVPVNIMLHGSPGVAKSSVVAQSAKEIAEVIGHPVELIDVRLGTMESSDVQGIPYTADNNHTMTMTSVDGNEVQVSMKSMLFSTPPWFPTNKSKFYILFFDEITNTSISTQHAAYRIILDRSIQNGEVLPETCAIIAAGNLKEDKTGAKSLVPAMANRFGMHLQIDVKESYKDFLNYAIKNSWHKDIIGFLTWKKESFYVNNGVEDAYATPRTWDFCNTHLNNAFLQKSNELMNIAVASAIGTSTAVDFMAYREYTHQLPNWEEVRSGKLRYEIPSKHDEALKFAIATTIAFEFVETINADLGSETENLLKVAEQLSDEIITVLVRTMGSIDKGITQKMLKDTNFKTLYMRTNAAVGAARGDSSVSTSKPQK